MNENEMKIMEQITAIKERLGKKLIILTHQYQRKEVVKAGDYCGDSFALSQKAADDNEAEFIVFCGVHFMAESAAILSKSNQIVQIPEVEAGCWMSEMIDIYMLERSWKQIKSITGNIPIIPVVYVNSDAQIKAFCGKNLGTACTSSNAKFALEWGLSTAEKVLFLPDQYLGRNTAYNIGIPKDEIIVWSSNKVFGGNTPNDIKKAKVILWDGYCLVHTRFKPEHILNMREKYPEAKVVVHPECTTDVVSMADAVGSTTYIVKYVENSKPDTTIIIGTETNLIQRLSIEHPDKKILELHHSLCPNMYKINLNNLFYTIENIGKVNVVTVPEETKFYAKKALDRMLSLK